MKTVLTLGTFDLLHAGHLELFRMCREDAGRGGRVVVAVNPDEFVERFKGRRPIIPLLERMEMVAACRDVDAVLVNVGAEDARPVIEAAAPHIIGVGDDWRDRDYFRQLGVDIAWLIDRPRPIAVTYYPRTRGQSATAIREQARTATGT